MAQAMSILSRNASVISIFIAFSALCLPLGFFIVWNIGANDEANAMGTYVGSGALTLRQAMLTAAIMEFSRASLMGMHRTSTVKNGILVANVFQEKDALLFAMLLASLDAAGTLLQVASYYCWPVSTTHCIVGSIVGFGLVYRGASAVFGSSIARVTSSWVISPVIEEPVLSSWVIARTLHVCQNM